MLHCPGLYCAVQSSSNSLQSGGGGSPGRERLVIRFRRITQRYYTVGEVEQAGWLNYGKLRHQFEDYEVCYDSPPVMFCTAI